MNDARGDQPNPTDGTENKKDDGPSYREITDDELATILNDHKDWLASDFEQSSRADLRHANLKGRNLSGADLRWANLKHATLWGADLRKTNLKSARLQGARLFRANLHDADLKSARLMGAHLRDAQGLNDCDLRNADLSDVSGLTGAEFAGTDLTGTTLPPEIQAFDGLDHATEISKHARNIFLAVIGGCVFSWLAIATTTDAALLTNSSSTPLPIIQTKVPIGGFYWAAPVILSALYLYLHLYLQRLWESLGSLPAIFPDGRPLDQKAYPWLLISLVRSHVPRLKFARPAFSRLQVLLSVIAAWGLVPATLLLFWLRYMPRHDWFWTRVHIALLALSVAFGAASYLRARATLRRRPAVTYDWRTAWRRPRVLAVNGIFIAVAAVALLLADGALKGVPPGSDLQAAAHRTLVPKLLRSLGYNPFLDLDEAELSVKPSRWTGFGTDEELDAQIAQVKKARLVDAPMRYADAESAVLIRADLRMADMGCAYLGFAELQGANLSNANLKWADLNNAELRKANFAESRLVGAILYKVKALGANFGKADLEGANLGDSDLRRTHFREAKLKAANLDGALLESAVLSGADLSDASLRDADLRGALFHGAELAGADFSGANLSRAEGLTQDQISGACGTGVTGLAGALAMQPCTADPVVREYFMCAVKSRP